ncbi:MAG: sulfide/dihydroorotate dehydrogenase-like FAD/NAD-binding protein [Methanomassiliicoccales archaeon]|nr:MAG: sulfide/dihydroorotate dehydrogenase-like FAD/NAD-binding protein [Methanomassiliicoccales archaeon]
MYKIVSKRELAPKIKQIEIEALRLAKKALPGQFVIIRVDEEGERFPITITDTDSESGTIKIAFNEVGKSSKQLGNLNQGDSILDVVGPLGRPSEVSNFGTVLCIGGGVMVPGLHYLARALRDAGCDVIGVVGARTKELLIYTKEMKEVCSEVFISTDDGSEGFKGLEFIKDEILEKKKIDRVVAWSVAEVTLKTVSDITKPYEIPTMVLLSTIMVDGTGMCGCCRADVGGSTKFACVDGPEFDGHQVDWQLLTSRKRMYLPEERLAALTYEGFSK